MNILLKQAAKLLFENVVYWSKSGTYLWNAFLEYLKSRNKTTYFWFGSFCNGIKFHLLPVFYRKANWFSSTLLISFVNISQIFNLIAINSIYSFTLQKLMGALTV